MGDSPAAQPLEHADDDDRPWVIDEVDMERVVEEHITAGVIMPVVPSQPRLDPTSARIGDTVVHFYGVEGNKGGRRAEIYCTNCRRHGKRCQKFRYIHR